MKLPILIWSLLATLSILEGRPTVAVSDFGAREDPTLESVIPNIITERLLNSGRFDLFERERLRAVLEEQELQSSGLVNPETAVSLGNIVGIDYIITGEIIDFGREVRSFSGFGAHSETVFFRLEAVVRVLETESGRIVFTKTERAEERQNQGAGIVVSDTTIDARLGRVVGEELAAALLGSEVFEEPEGPGGDLAMLRITSEPEQASVEIDGIFYGNAGGSFEIPAGLHKIRVSLPGYEIWDKRVMVRDGGSFHVPLVRKADIRVEVDEDTRIRTEGPQ